MIALSWLLAPVIAAPVFCPQMATEIIWDKHTQTSLTCLPPTTEDDLPWILYFGILAFILPFTALIVLQVMVLIKQQNRMKTIIGRFEEKVRMELTRTESFRLLLSDDK